MNNKSMEKWKSQGRLTFQGALQQNSDYSKQKSSENNCAKILTTCQSKNKIAKANLDEYKERPVKGINVNKNKEISQSRKKEEYDLINKYQQTLTTYIQEHKADVKFSGPKRFWDKSGEYYLKTVLIEKNFDKDPPTKIIPKGSSKQSSTLNNSPKKNNGKRVLTRKASEIGTKAPKNSFTPIPVITKKNSMSRLDGKELSNAARTAVHIRRLEYSSEMKRTKPKKPPSQNISSIIFIQRWWRTIYSIIMIQRFYRGWIFRKKLMHDLDKEENLIENLLIIEKACNKLVMKSFIEKLAAMTHSLLPRLYKKIIIKETIEQKVNSYNSNELLQLKNYISKWSLKSLATDNISFTDIPRLLKQYKYKNAYTVKINKAIEKIRVVILNPLYVQLKPHKKNPNKKERVLKIFENKLSSYVINNTLPNTVQSTNLSPDINNHLRLSSNINSTDYHLNKTETEEDFFLKHNYDISGYFYHWKDLVFLKRIMIQIVKERLQKKHNKNKEYINIYLKKWRKYVQYKGELKRLISLLSNHNKSLRKSEKKKQYLNQLNHPNLSNCTIIDKLRKNNQCMSENDEIECFLDNHAIFKPSNSVIDKDDKGNDDISFDMKKNQGQVLYSKRTPESDGQFDDLKHEDFQIYSSYSHQEQLDQNANTIQYDETLITKSRKCKAMFDQNLFDISNQCFGIQSVRLYIDNSRSLITRDSQTISVHTIDMGIGTEQEERERRLKSIIRCIQLKYYINKWIKSNYYNDDNMRYITYTVENMSSKAFVKKTKKSFNNQLDSSRSFKPISSKNLENGITVAHPNNTFINTKTKIEDKEEISYYIPVKGYKKQYINTSTNHKVIRRIFFAWRKKSFLAKIFKCLKQRANKNKAASSKAKIKDTLKRLLKKIIFKLHYSKLNEYFRPWEKLTKERMKYKHLTYQLQTVLSHYYSRVIFYKIKSLDTTALTNVWNKWKSGQILARLTLAKKKHKAMSKMTQIRQSNTLYNYFIEYYTQAKAITLEEVESFILKCHRIINYHHFNSFINNLRLKPLLKIIEMKKKKNRKTQKKGLFKLYEVFTQWKSTVDNIIKEEDDFDFVRISRNFNDNVLVTDSSKPFTFRAKSIEKYKTVSTEGRDPVFRSLTRKRDGKKIHQRLNNNNLTCSLNDSELLKSNHSFTNNSLTITADFIKEELLGKESQNKSFELIETQHDKFKLINSSGHSLHNLPSLSNEDVNKGENQQIQITKPTVSLSNDKEKTKNCHISKHIIQKAIVNNSKNEFAPSNNNDNNNTDVNRKIELKEEANMESEALKANAINNNIELVNNDNKINVNKVPYCHKRYKSSCIDDNKVLLSNFKNETMIRHLSDKGNEIDGPSQSNQANTSKFYFSPAKDTNENAVGIFSNITKSIKRGKMPVFHSKKNSLNMTNTSISALSLTQMHESICLNKCDDIKKSLNQMMLSNSLYESMDNKLTLSSSYLDINSNGNDNKIKTNNYLTNQIFNTDSGINDNYPYAHYQTQSNVTENTQKLFETISDEFQEVPKQSYDSTSSLPKIIKSKTIRFKNEEEKRTSKIKPIQTQQIIFKVNQGQENHLSNANYYFKGQTVLISHKLRIIGESLRNHTNLCYMLKLTLIHRSTNQLSLIKVIIDYWKESIQKNNKKSTLPFKLINSSNSLLLIGSKYKNAGSEINADLHFE